MGTSRIKPHIEAMRLACRIAILALAAWPVAAEPWVHRGLATHPQVGHIFETASGARLSEPELRARAAAARFLALGEKHDNADHHRLQARLVAAQPVGGSVVLEMIDRDRDRDLVAFQMRDGWRPAALGAAIGWEAAGWPAWGIYQPIAEAARRRHALLRGGDLTTFERRAIGRGEAPDDAPLDSDSEADLRREVAGAHCGHAPAAALPAMARVHRARDASLARRMAALAAGPEAAGPVALIAGNGHVRRDRGVPWHLATLGFPRDQLLVVGILEVPRDGAMLVVESLRAQYDVVWITPRVDMIDPCEQFAEQLRRMRGRS
jgi:uncharacterized iron-regulated protein